MHEFLRLWPWFGAGVQPDGPPQTWSWEAYYRRQSRPRSGWSDPSCQNRTCRRPRLDRRRNRRPLWTRV